MREAIVMVQKWPAKDSEMRAPMRGVKLAVPPKIVSVLAADTNGIFNS